MLDQIKKAANTLESGGIVVFPTETVYGIGCVLSQTKTIDKLYDLKKRESEQASLVLVKDLKMAQDYVKFNTLALKLAKKFWPGPLTMALPCQRRISKKLLGPDDSLAVRVSSNNFLNALFEHIDEPVLAPSANFKGERPPTTFSEIDKRLADKVDYVVSIEPDGLKPSTIINFAGSTYNILREGAITKEQIDKQLAF